MESINPSSRVRKALYIITAVGSPIVAYVALKGYVGEAEVALWTALVSVVSALAGFNVTPDEEVSEEV